MKDLLLIASLLIFILGCGIAGANISSVDASPLSGAVAAQNLKPRELPIVEPGTRFLELCLNSNDPGVRHTVRVIKRKIGSLNDSCEVTKVKLSQLEALDLKDEEIADISPLADLANLRDLSLLRNQISDISALIHLSGLTSLTLAGNSISDIGPLTGLTNLTDLDIDGNLIVDVSPLAELTSLDMMFLDNNEIDFSNSSACPKNTGNALLNHFCAQAAM